MKNKLEYKKNKKGVFEQSGETVEVEKEETHCRCGYCQRIITFKYEAGGKPFMKRRKPICAVCRIMKGKCGKIIKKDKKEYVKDVLEKEKIIDAKELERTKEVGLASQNRTGTNTNNQKQICQ